MGPNEARLRENQRAFRAGNERLNAVVEPAIGRESVFVIVSDHPLAGDELVVREFGGYQVVRA